MNDKLQLIVRKGATQIEKHKVGPDTVLGCGRSSSNEIVLTDRAVSRFHARFTNENGVLAVEDLGSMNGTIVNGQTIPGKTPVLPGDIVEMGPFEMRLETEKTPSRARVMDVDAPAQLTMHSLSLQDLISSEDPTSIKKGSIPAAAGPAQGTGVDAFFKNIDAVGRRLLSHRPLQEIYQTVIDLTVELLAPDRVALLILDDGSLATKATHDKGGPAAADIVISKSIAQQAIRERQAILSSDAMKDDRFQAQASVADLRIHSAMCVPLWDDKDVIGLLYADNRSVLPFKEDDLKLLTLIGHFAAIKIRETIASEQVARQKKLEEEMRTAAEIQQNLLPKQKLQSSAVTLYGENIPSFEVGGDYFDYFPQSDGQIWAVLGDVSGKGLSAAMLMSNLHAMLHAHVEASPRLADLTTQLNKSVFRITHGERFITFFVARFDPRTGEGAYVNAGHNPPFLLRKDGSIDTLEEGGLFLGSFPECAYERGVFALGEGDTLLLYSDGITEAADESGDMFGEDRLAEFLRAHAGEEPDVFVPKLLDTVFDFSENRDPGDDATVLVIRRR